MLHPRLEDPVYTSASVSATATCAPGPAWRRTSKRTAGRAHRRPPTQPGCLFVSFIYFTVFEGGFILTRAMDEPDHLSAQLANVRHYLELLFGLSPGQPGRGRRRGASA
jgi:hypothetical protein